MRELPGFYFDEEKKRYFPNSHRQVSESHKSKKAQVSTARVASSNDLRKPLHDYSLIRLLQQRELGHYWGNPNSLPRPCVENNAAQMKTVSHRWAAGSGGAVKWIKRRFQTKSGEVIVGSLASGGRSPSDNMELFDFTCSEAATCSSLSGVNNIGSSPLDDCGPPFLNPPQLLRMPILLSERAAEVHSIHALPAANAGTLSVTEKLLSVSFGDFAVRGQVLIQSMAGDMEGSHGVTEVFQSGMIVWTSAISPSGDLLSLGHEQGAILLNLQTLRSQQALCVSHSAVMAQDFDSAGRVVFCGFRNGAIASIDTRLRPPLPARRSDRNPENSNEPWQYCSHAPCMVMPSSVCSLKCLRSDEKYIVASAMDGSVSRWDRRMPRRPVLAYKGHVNSHTYGGLAMDASETVLLLGGEDCVVRTWSVASGKLLGTMAALDEPVTAMDVMPNDGMFWRGRGDNGREWVRDPFSVACWLGTRSFLHFARNEV